jgi:hypothetical protein
MITKPILMNCSPRVTKGATKACAAFLILASLLLVYFGTEAFRDSALIKGRGVGRMVPRLAAPHPTMSLGQYFRWGMWRADARTLFAEARFLLDWSRSALEDRPTRFTVTVGTPNMAMPTNTAAAGPTA